MVGAVYLVLIGEDQPWQGDSVTLWQLLLKYGAYAEALQNPQQMIQLLERKLQAGAPLNAQEQYLLSLLRGVPAAATSN